MKILHIVPTYYPAFAHGGPIFSVHNLNKWLVKLGIDVTVYTTNINGKRFLDVLVNQEIDVDGVRVYYFSSTIRRWEYSFEMHHAIKKNIKKFDLVHITSVFLAASTLGAHYAKRNNIPYIISPRGSLMVIPLNKPKAWLKNWLKKIYIVLIERNNLKLATAIHFTVPKEKEEYLEQGLPIKSDFIIPNSLDSRDFDVSISPDFYKKKLKREYDYNLVDEDKIILSLGRFEWKKGFDILIPAFSKVIEVDPHVRLVIAGEGDNYKPKIQEYIKKEINLEVGKNIFFTGMLTGEDKVAAFRDAEVFVLPSYSENFGMAVMESAASGTAVVVTNEVGVSNYIKNSNAGIVVNKNEPEEIKNAILKIIQNPEKEKTMGEQGREIVKKEFNPEIITQRFIEEYKKIIDELK